MGNRTWKARIFAATSLDGFIARKDGDILWLTQPKQNPEHIPPSSPKKTPTFEQHMSGVDFIVMGRETYEVCLAFAEWPYPTGKNLLVLSTTLQSPASNGPQPTRVVASLEEVEKILAEEEAKMLYVDGGKTVQEFLKRGWIDELVHTHTPVLLGGGRPLFSNLPEDVHFTLRGVDVIEDGMVTSYYQVS